jgi:hypothetical protein
MEPKPVESVDVTFLQFLCGGVCLSPECTVSPLDSALNHPRTCVLMLTAIGVCGDKSRVEAESMSKSQASIVTSVSGDPDVQSPYACKRVLYASTCRSALFVSIHCVALQPLWQAFQSHERHCPRIELNPFPNAMFEGILTHISDIG